MVYLYLIFLLVALFAERKSKMKCFWRLLIPLVYSALVGFRGIDVGIDTHTYYESYYAGGEEGLGFVEPGFDWINTHLFKWGFDANFSFFVYALLTNFFFFLSLEKMANNNYSIPAFCLYFLTYTELINGIRQDLACAMFIYALFFIREGKPIYYACVILLGSLFHVSVLLMLPFYFIRKLTISPRFYIFFYIASFIGVFFDISSYIPALELFNRDYGRYVENLRTENASWLGFTITNITNFLTLVFIINTKLYKEHKEICLFSLLYFVFTNLGYNIPIINRVSALFIWFVYFLYAEIWANRRRYIYNKNYALGVALLIALNLSFIGNNLVKDNYQYYFYWENRPIDFTHKYT